MSFDPHIAERRFGYGRSPDVPPPASVAAMMAALRERDATQKAYPLPPFRVLQDALVKRRRFYSFARKNPDTAKGKDALETARLIDKDVQQQRADWFVQLQMRRVRGQAVFGERLVAFWADHFTAFGKGGLLRAAAPLYVEEAIRPRITGRFADLLTAAVTHPLMLHYLDQNSSAGPNSRAAKGRPGRLGLNENLAREVLELHTLGVDAPYAQRDVTELAELLTGLSVTRDYGFKFRNRMVEPGAETVLGKTYSEEKGIGPVRAVLDDLARHPATARHVARKLAVHFVSDAPPGPLVDAIADAYQASDGHLEACYDAMLRHPAAWGAAAHNMRPPDEFVSAALRALNPSAKTLATLKRREMRRLFHDPLRLMGQPWMRPNGPDGFPENDSAWVTPQGIATRLEWAMNAPGRLLERLPDPRAFVTTALGDDVPPAVAFAARSAEDRRVAIGLILASPAFQRR